MFPDATQYTGVTYEQGDKIRMSRLESTLLLFKNGKLVTEVPCSRQLFPTVALSKGTVVSLVN